jgi:hypothetical protein
MVHKPVAAHGATRSQLPRPGPPAAAMPSHAQRTLALQRLADDDDNLTSAFLARDRGRPDGAPPPTPLAPRSPAAVLQRAFKYQDAMHNINLVPHEPALRREVENAGADEKVLASFDKAADAKAARKFDVWAKKEGVDWKPILKTVVGIDVAREQQREQAMFGRQRPDKKYQGGRLEGVSLSGFIPIHPTAGNELLTTVPRSGPGRFDYTVDEDRRILQFLRQLSTQLYGHLTDMKKLAKEEQEIQTMLAFGNLLIASNKPETTANLADELRSLKGPTKTGEALFEMLTTTHYKKARLRELSTRHAKKLGTFYDDVRQFRTQSPRLQQVVETLVKAEIHTITDLNDHRALEAMTKNPGRIYILSAPSISGVAHAEQRLIELRDIANVFLADPVAWVAGKKRPCFGCWIHETLANTRGGYRLVYQDQPGKAFMNTYRDAQETERDHWHTTLADEDFVFAETEGLGGEAGPESDSEAEEPLPEFDDADKLVATLELDPIKPAHRGALKRHWEAAGGDFDAAEEYARSRKKTKVEASENQMLVDIDNLATWAAKSPNPVFRRRYSLKKRRTPKKETTT